jgi:hypothetical protein
VPVASLPEAPPSRGQKAPLPTKLTPVLPTTLTPQKLYPSIPSKQSKPSQWSKLVSPTLAFGRSLSCLGQMRGAGESAIEHILSLLREWTHMVQYMGTREGDWAVIYSLRTVLAELSVRSCTWMCAWQRDRDVQSRTVIAATVLSSTNRSSSRTLNEQAASP